MRFGTAFLAMCTLGFVVLVSAGASPALAGSAGRHSGTVIAVTDHKTPTLVLEEIVEGAKMRELRVLVTRETRLIRSERVPDTQVSDLRYPFHDAPIRLSDIRIGDFVVVELGGADDKTVASSVTVTFRRGK